MIPDAPGWWILELAGGPEWMCWEVHASYANDGLYLHIPVCRVAPDGDSPMYTEDHVPVSHATTGENEGSRWLGPVAPPGSVAPEEHARAVRDAYLSDWIDGFPDHGWGGSSPRRDLIARVGADVVEQVER